MDSFDIRAHLEFDDKGRAICPCCQSDKGAGYKKRNLSVLDSGAYKCHRGCSPEAIRAAMGTPKKTAPDALAPPQPKATVTPAKVQAAHTELLSKSTHALNWLRERLIDDDIIRKFKLGIGRAKCGDKYEPCIVIPIPANGDRTAFYQKKRLSPWIEAHPNPEYKPWSQFGIPAMVFFTYQPETATATWLCEGEWDAMLLGHQAEEAGLNVAVACFTCGAGTIPPEAELNRLPGKIYIFYDRDKPGEEGAAKLTAKLGDRGRPALVPRPDDCQVKGWDVSNALQHGYTLTDFQQAVERADFTKPREPQIDFTAIATTRKGRMLNLLKEHYSDRLEFNDMTKQVEMDGEKIDPDFVYLALLEQGIDVGSKEFAIDVFLYLAKKRQYNPVRQYLEAVAANHPANEALLDQAAQRYLKTDDPLHAAFLRKTLIAAVARILNPGCKVDTALFFTGAQGLGKSTFWSILAGEQFFCDSLGGQTSETDEKIKLYSAWIHEWAELEQVFKRKETSQVKSFLSATHDTFRMPWGRTTEKFPRHSIIVGTTNEDDFLADPTGSRRYWVIPLKHKICLELAERDRDALWAAAVHAYRAGASWILSPEEGRESEARNRNYQREEPWFEQIASYAATRETVRISDLLQETEIKLELSRQDKWSQMRVADVLKALGWQRKHTESGKIWVKPEIGSQVVSQSSESSHSNSSRTDYLFTEGSQEVVSSQDNNNLTTSPDYLNDLTTGKKEVVSPETPSPSGIQTPPDYLTTKNGSTLSSFEKSGKSDHGCNRNQFEVGDHVEILKGQFVGKRCQVEAVESGSVTVRAKGWYVSQIYPPDELRLLSNRKSRIEERDRALANGATLAEALKQYPDEV